MTLFAHGEVSERWHPSLFTFDEQELQRGELSQVSKDAISEVAYQCFAETGLKDWTFEFHAPEKYVLGQCYRETKTITLCSRNYALLKHPYLVRKGLYHEIAHALTPQKIAHPGSTRNQWLELIHGQEWKDCFKGFGFPTAYGWRNVANEFAQAVCFTRRGLIYEEVRQDFYDLKTLHSGDVATVSVAAFLKTLELLTL